ncbi:MAG: thioredoxin family protein [Actinomycetota bacterium]
MPVIDQVSSDYVDDVTFLAVAGRGDIEATRERADQLFGSNLMWGLDDSIWGLYGIPGQPASVLITDGVVVDMWFGAVGEQELRNRLDNLVSLAG